MLTKVSIDSAQRWYCSQASAVKASKAGAITRCRRERWRMASNRRLRRMDPDFRQDDERGLPWGAIALSANWPTLPIWPF
jgi:hypothetical protein